MEPATEEKSTRSARRNYALGAANGTMTRLGMSFIHPYVLALCMVGLAIEAITIGLNAFILESAPADRRPSYVAFLSTASFPFTFLPALAGALVGSSLHRLEALFATCVVSGLLTSLAVWHLREIRPSKARPS